MVKLNEYISDGIEKGNNSREKYLGICHGVIKYAEQYPIYFNMTTDFINIDMDKARYVKTERDTKKIPLAFILQIWGMLSGVIKLGINKVESNTLKNVLE